MTAIDQALVERARLHVRRWFARRMPKHLVFHDLGHTENVARTVVALARASGLKESDRCLLEIAALFHDTGYALSYNDHEEHGARLADAFLAQQGVAQRGRSAVRSLILATRAGARPSRALHELLRDADSANAGQADFEARSMLLRKEREDQRGKRIKDGDWLQANLDYLLAHRFYSREAQKRYAAQKRINLDRIQGRKARAERVSAVAPRSAFIDRDISWLAFNDRVLQEAKDRSNPLLERVRFLAIHSSNLDEFYRVRVASLRSLARLGRSTRAALEVPPEKRIARINALALAQQQEFGRLWRGELLPALKRKGIRILDEQQLNPVQRRFTERFAQRTIMPLLGTASVREGTDSFIEDRKLYFVCRLSPQLKGGKERLVLVNIPSDALGRFVSLPSARGEQDILFLDDAVRLCLPKLFGGHKVLSCHAIKLSRDAELHLDEEFTGTVKEKVRKSLGKRITGMPARLLYDAAMPKRVAKALRQILALGKDDLMQGGRYHHFSDLHTLPIRGHAELRHRPWRPLNHQALARGKSLFSAAEQGGLLFHFPYHDFGQITQWLQKAARDPGVKRIWITLYRVAPESAVCEALLLALKQGKQVHAFVEVQARFDEGHNLTWGERLEQAGAQVNYGYEGLKVHAKLCLIERVARGHLKRYAYLGTGNFNERTARLYTDTCLITTDPALCAEVNEVFRHLTDRRHPPRTRHLLVAPLSLRDSLERLIDAEIRNAAMGLPAGITLKLNSLEDRALINKLYSASQAGVPIRLIVRGICCLIPGVPGLSENIEAISIVDRFLEHARAYVFTNGGDPLVYLSSADWMGRNLDRRVEVAFPITDRRLRDEVLRLIEIQWSDRAKARVIDAKQTNQKRRALGGHPKPNAQRGTYLFLRRGA